MNESNIPKSFQYLGKGSFDPITAIQNVIYDIGNLTSGGSGTVTSTSVVTANGFAGTVATATTTPAITITTSVTGLLKGNGTSISAAVSGTDYLVPTAALLVNGTQPSTGVQTFSAGILTDTITSAVGGVTLTDGATNGGVVITGNGGITMMDGGNGLNLDAITGGITTRNGGIGFTGTALPTNTLTIVDGLIVNVT